MKSIVTDISFAAPGDDGKLTTMFQPTFDLGKHKVGDNIHVRQGKTPFIGQDSGPVSFPKIPEDKGNKINLYVAMKVTASVIEHGQGRGWIRGVTDSLRDKENRKKILQPLVDALLNKDNK
jgi:hypothetical protein